MKNRMVQGLDFLRLKGGLLSHNNHWQLYFKKGILIAMGTLTWAGICHLMENHQKWIDNGINNFNF